MKQIFYGPRNEKLVVTYFLFGSPMTAILPVWGHLLGHLFFGMAFARQWQQTNLKTHHVSTIASEHFGDEDLIIRL